MENPEADPLLQPGSFIHPIVVDADDVSDPIPNQMNSADVEAPDWLPPGWRVKFRVRTSGVSVGHKDKYYVDPVSQRWFRSRKEVQTYLDTGVIGNGKKRNGVSDAESTARGSKHQKTAQKVSIENFKFNDPPKKAKWVMTDFNSGTWRAMAGDGGADVMVPESSLREWAAAFNCMSLQKNFNAAKPKTDIGDA